MKIDFEALAVILGGVRPDQVVPLHGDGSSRRFFRIACGKERRVLCVGPDPAENAAYVRIARHLSRRGVRVPSVDAWDESRGWILMEDLGDLSLCGAARSCRNDEDLLALYGPVLDLLVQMQLRGAEGFDLSVGFAPAPYDGVLRVEGEGMYFAREFAGSFLGLSVSAGFEEDLRRLSEEAADAPGGYFLHRDFQSRNIQILNKEPVLIDFQGARPGPLAYDAAALILDPYTGLSTGLQKRLLEEYWGRLERAGAVDVDAARSSWFSIAAFRLLQALGAFGKLGGRLKKPGFLEHIPTALEGLGRHLEARRAEFPFLSELVERCRQTTLGRLPGGSPEARK